MALWALRRENRHTFIGIAGDCDGGDRQTWRTAVFAAVVWSRSRHSQDKNSTRGGSSQAI